MPTPLAIIVCLAFILAVAYYERKGNYNIAGPTWIVFIWILILSSRPISLWLGVGGSGDELEGNAFDRNLYLLLTAGAVVTIGRRGYPWRAAISSNWPLFALWGYMLVTCVWSDHPFVTFKRWFKDLTAFAIILVIVSSVKPSALIKAVASRCALILFLLSYLFINYIPELGRVYSRSGGLQIVGITTQKNTLGEIAVICILLLVWRMAEDCSGNPGRSKLRLIGVPFALCVLGGYLLWQSDSKTSLLSLILGLVVLFSHKLPLVRNRPMHFLVIAGFAVPALYLGNSALGLSDYALELLGRDATLTGRTGIWHAIVEHPVNPWLGVGYLMYWDELGFVEINGYPTELKTAHNGYIDVYLDGGILGLFFLSIMVLSSARTTASAFLKGDYLGRLRFAFFSIMMLANISESFFLRRGPLWFFYLLFCMNYPVAHSVLPMKRARPRNRRFNVTK